MREFRAWTRYTKNYYTKPMHYSYEQRRIIYDRELNGTEYYYGNYKRRENTWIEGNLKAKGFFYYGGDEPYYSGKIYGKTIPSLAKRELRYTGLREFMKSIEFISPLHEPDGTVRQKRTEFNRQHSDIEQAEQFLCKWQKQLQKKLTKMDFELATHSKKLRKKELDEMRNKKIKINGGDYAGRLLADVLEADVLEMQDREGLAA